MADITQQKPSPKPSSRAYDLAIRLFTAETRLCVTRERPEIVPGDKIFLGRIFDVVLPVLIVVHLFLGSMIFSSLLFIGVRDTWPILLRYGLSATMAKLIRMFEVAGLHRAYNKTFEVDDTNLVTTTI